MPRRPRIRKGDTVILIAGKDKGKRGNVLRVDPARERCYVEGLNIVKRHERPQQVSGAQRSETVGGVIEKPGPIHLSNVALLDPDTDRPTRIGMERDGSTRRRIARRSGKAID